MSHKSDSKVILNPNQIYCAKSWQRFRWEDLFRKYHQRLPFRICLHLLGTEVMGSYNLQI